MKYQSCRWICGLMCGALLLGGCANQATVTEAKNTISAESISEGNNLIYLDESQVEDLVSTSVKGMVESKDEQVITLVLQADSEDEKNQNHDKPGKSSGGPEGNQPQNGMPGGEPPTGDMPGGEPPTGDMPGGEPPTGDMPEGGTPQTDDMHAENNMEAVGTRVILILTDTSILKKESDTEEATLEDITPGNMLTITFDEAGEITQVLISERTDGMGSQDGMGKSGNGGGPSQSNGVDSYDAVTEYTEDTTIEGESFSSTGTDENAILVSQDATVSLKDIILNRTSTDSTGGEQSSFYGVGAGILTIAGNTYIIDSTISTDAAGGAGAFAYNTGNVYVKDTTISTKQNTSGGIHVAGGGSLYAWNDTVTTQGNSAAAIRSDRGGGTMVVDGGSYISHGTGSPAIYCTADIAVHDATLTATGSEAICMEGLNTIRLFDCDITGNMSDDKQNDTTWNIIVYQSMSGDAEVGNSTLQIAGGSITAQNGGLLYTTNTECNIYLSDVDITYADDSEFFLMCTGNQNQRGWGSTGKNGSQCIFTADRQLMQGDIIWDSISTLDFYMTNNSKLIGAIRQDETYAGNGGSGYCNISIDKDATWIVTGDSVVSKLSNTGIIQDDKGQTVSIIGSDGTVYIDGNSTYTVTVEQYETTVDMSDTAQLSPWSEHEVSLPAAMTD